MVITNGSHECNECCLTDRCAQSKVLVHCKMGISRSASTVLQLFLVFFIFIMKFGNRMWII